MAYVEKYNRRRAVNYAKRWAYERNPRYYDYSGIGGDCTNFVSQCLYAGSGVMNYTPTFGWYYINANDKSPSWTGVQYLYDFLVSNTQRGVFGVEIGLEDVSDGDVIQLYGDGRFYHSMLVVSHGDKPTAENTLIATHSFNALNRPLSTYKFESFRVVLIEGVYI